MYQQTLEQLLQKQLQLAELPQLIKPTMVMRLLKLTLLWQQVGLMVTM